MATTPLSVVIATREGLTDLQPVLGALVPQTQRIGAETLIVGPVDPSAAVPARLVPVEDRDIYRLRAIGIREAQGEVIAIGEDHAVPRPDWCEAILRAHAEHPHVPAVLGCLVNATIATVSGRANFLAFAAPFEPPMPTVPTRRAPPLSALSLKRSVFDDLDEWVGEFETELVPRLCREGLLISDDRIVVDHYQDHGIAWSIRNGFHGARASYGYLRSQVDWPQRYRHALRAISTWPRWLVREARQATSGAGGSQSPMDIAVVAAIAMGVGLGGAFGSLIGPGRSPDRVA